MPSSSPNKRPFQEWMDSFGTASDPRRRGLYVVMGALCTAAALFAFSLIDLFAGRPTEFAQSFVIALLFVAISTRLPYSNPKTLARFTLVISLAAISQETFIGANGGFTFLWMYLLPLGSFFVLGRREGSAWVGFATIVLAWLTFVIDRRTTPDGDVGVIVLATFALLSILGYGLESARSRLSNLLIREQEELKQALSDLETLYGLVPICASCKSVRDDRGYWHDIESYLSKHSKVELQAAFCPDCRQRADVAAPPPVETTPDSTEKPAPGGDPRHEEHRQRRRVYYTVGMSVLIPFMAYFGSIDIWAGRFLEASLVYGLAAFFLVTLWMLHTGRPDRTAYDLAAGASLLVMGYEFWIGAYGGYATLWLYSYPAFSIFVLGHRGAVWSIAASVMAAVFLLSPLGFSYPPAMSGRFLATYLLVVLMTYGLETARRRRNDRLTQESIQLRQTLSRVRTLRGLLPICPSCKKVKDDEGFWEQIETHVTRVSGTRFTHGLCPNCVQESFSDIVELPAAP